MAATALFVLSSMGLGLIAVMHVARLIEARAGKTTL
jgi:hypothetical protein